MIKSENFLYNKTLQNKFRYFSIKFKSHRDSNEIEKLLKYELTQKSRNFVGKKYVAKKISSNEILIYFVCPENDNYDWLRLLEDILKKYDVEVEKTTNLNFDPLNSD